MYGKNPPTQLRIDSFPCHQLPLLTDCFQTLKHRRSVTFSVVYFILMVIVYPILQTVCLPLSSCLSTYDFLLTLIIIVSTLLM